MWVLSTAIDMFITIWQTFDSTMFALWSEIENIDMHWCEVNYRINYKHNKFLGKRILKTGVIKNSSQFKWNAIILSKTSCWKVSLSFLSSLNVFRYGRMGQAIILQRILLQWVQFSVKELNCIRSALDKHYTVLGLSSELYGHNTPVVWCKGFSDYFKFGECYVAELSLGTLSKPYVDNYGSRE